MNLSLNMWFYCRIKIQMKYNLLQMTNKYFLIIEEKLTNGIKQRFNKVVLNKKTGNYRVNFIQ